MALSHYTNSPINTLKYEPIHGSLFDVLIELPKQLDGTNLELLRDHINNVGGLQAINPALDLITQKYRFSTRSFAGMPGETAVDITMELSMNLNDANQAYTYKILRDWYRLTYDPNTGYCGIKKDYVGNMTIFQYNRNGDIFRTVKLYDVFPSTAPEAMDSLDYNTHDPMTASVTFRCDYYEEILK